MEQYRFFAETIAKNEEEREEFKQTFLEDFWKPKQTKAKQTKVHKKRRIEPKEEIVVSDSSVSSLSLSLSDSD